MPETKKVSQLIDLIFTFTRQARQLMKDDSGASPLNIIYAGTLKFIAETGEPTMKEVSDYLSIAPPSATFLINNLADSGQIKRIHDEKDRRIVRLALTEKGKEDLKEHYQKVAERMKKIFSRLSEKEVEELFEVFNNLTRLLKA